MTSIFRLLLKYCKSQRNFFAVWDFTTIWHKPGSEPSTELIIMRNNAVQLGFQIVTAKILLKPQAWEMKNLFWILQRNGHWSNNYSNGNGIPNGASPADVNNSSGSGSQRGSQSALLSVKKERHKWPKGKDFLFSTWAFVIGKFYLAKTWILWNETFSNTVT